MKKKLVFCILVILVLLTIGIILLIRTRTSRYINYTKNINTNIENINLENRAKLMVDGYVLIGENKKELENGYYDFKVSHDDNLLKLSLNKLWHKEYGKDYIQDDYLANICREVVKCIENLDYKEELEYRLYKYIKDNYLIVKQGKEVEKINLEQISIWALYVNGECVINIKVE